MSVDPPTQEVTAATRSVDDWETEIRNTLRVEPEHRTVWIFSGLQAQNGCFSSALPHLVPMYCSVGRAGLPRTWRKRAMRRHRTLAIRRENDDSFEYLATQQAVRYTLRLSGDKQQFEEKLHEEGAFVMYLGHARYGRGPCFGSGCGRYTGEDWQLGDANHTGIFRMGYRWIGCPADELASHDYSAVLMRPSDGRPEAADSHPDLTRALAGRPNSLVQRDPTSLGIADQVVGNGDVWAYHARSHGRAAWHVIHRAGAEDLTHTRPRCRVFAHLGCSSRHSNEAIWRAARQANPCISVWTTASSKIYGALYFLYRLLAYDQVSAGQPWQPWIGWAKDQASTDLRYDGESYQLALGSV